VATADYFEFKCLGNGYVDAAAVPPPFNNSHRDHHDSDNEQSDYD
jgi:hypothetical protein